MEKINLICIECPMGCNLEVIKHKDIEVKGNKCKRGKDYALKEIENPKRVLTTTVILKNSYLKRLPVRSEGEIPKSLLFECIDYLNKIEVEAPVKMGQVIVENILNTGINIIASRSAEKLP
ncbi:CxxC motif-containing protein [Caloramator fervidus]|uniref:CxxC motif-containing protein n=1 Tax=Caloramator fervidus TaxID=29344 RepID=A0A1H5RTP4_9CLOT|nr:DUF1667 domain-containing protein [Caloramator fervidus]SEF41723.1 CxxC motif-containing protein [Caloramator fervidus]